MKVKLKNGDGFIEVDSECPDYKIDTRDKVEKLEDTLELKLDEMRVSNEKNSGD